MRTHETAKAPDWVDEAIAGKPAILTLKEASEILRYCPRQLRRLIRAGRLHGVRPVESGSSPMLIPRAEVARFLRSLEAQ